MSSSDLPILGNVASAETGGREGGVRTNQGSLYLPFLCQEGEVGNAVYPETFHQGRGSLITTIPVDDHEIHFVLVLREGRRKGKGGGGEGEGKAGSMKDVFQIR